MRRITLLLVALVLLAIALLVLLVPGTTLRSLRMTVRSTLQEEPDYDRLEADRVARADTPVEPTTDAAPHPTWTDFRGPARRGEYHETPITTEWPEAGLPLLWRRRQTLLRRVASRGDAGVI